MKTYEQMLEEGIKALPEQVVVTNRFEIPKAKGHVQGNKTVITNFNDILGTLRREREHFLKFLLKELATPGVFDGPRLVLGRKVTASFINEKIKVYTENFVLCNECGKPDTQIIKKDDATYLKCTACGAQRKVKV
jgi:translation initiation factor 2 subunit 2